MALAGQGILWSRCCPHPLSTATPRKRSVPRPGFSRSSIANLSFVQTSTSRPCLHVDSSARAAKYTKFSIPTPHISQRGPDNLLPMMFGTRSPETSGSDLRLNRVVGASKTVLAGSVAQAALTRRCSERGAGVGLSSPVTTRIPATWETMNFPREIRGTAA